MDRVNLFELNKVRDKEDIPGEFLSVKGEYFIDSVGKTAFYKETGWMPADAAYDADLRELLAAQILELIDVPHADIILAKAGEDKGCLSINILNDNEEFSNIDLATDIYRHGECTLEEFLEEDSYKISNLPGITQEMIKERKEFVKIYLFVNALLSNPDVKMDHIIPIYNSETGKYRNPELIDMGLAFTNYMVKSFPFKNANSPEELLKELYEKYPTSIFQISQRVQQNLTAKVIKKMLRAKVFRDIFSINFIEEKLLNRISIISKYNQNIIEYGTAFPVISLSEIAEKTKDVNISLKESVKKVISELRNKILKKEEQERER